MAESFLVIDEHGELVAVGDPFEWLALEQDRAGAGPLRRPQPARLRVASQTPGRISRAPAR